MSRSKDTETKQNKVDRGQKRRLQKEEKYNEEDEDDESGRG
jgi:hypothetical protein